MTEEKKLIVGLNGMQKRLKQAGLYLQRNGQKGEVDRCERDCLLIGKAIKALEGPKTRLMDVHEVLENPETLIWLEHYRNIDNGPVLTPTAMYPYSEGEGVDGYVKGTDEGYAAHAEGIPPIMDFYCGDIYQTGAYGKMFRCWIGDMPSDVFRKSVPWDD